MVEKLNLYFVGALFLHKKKTNTKQQDLYFFCFQFYVPCIIMNLHIKTEYFFWKYCSYNKHYTHNGTDSILPVKVVCYSNISQCPSQKKFDKSTVQVGFILQCLNEKKMK